MAAKKLADLRELVESDLVDAGNVTWSTAELDRAIRQALQRYSLVRPWQAIATINAADGREYSLAALTGLIDVEAVWWPYDAADTDALPAWCDFELWNNNTVLFLKSAECPAADAHPLRVFYTRMHTIKDLDGAATSTYFEEDEEMLVLGAVAYAAVQQARYTVDAVNASARTPEHFMSWARARMDEFEAALVRLAWRVNRHRDNRVPVLVQV